MSNGLKLKHQPRATIRRLLALKYLADNEGIAHLNAIHENTGFVDNRVLLLSLAELALHQHIDVIEGLCKITEKGRGFYNDNRHILRQHLAQAERAESVLKDNQQ